MKDDVEGSYVVPASRIVEVLREMKTEQGCRIGMMFAVSPPETSSQPTSLRCRADSPRPPQIVYRNRHNNRVPVDGATGVPYTRRSADGIFSHVVHPTSVCTEFQATSITAHAHFGSPFGESPARRA